MAVYAEANDIKVTDAQVTQTVSAAGRQPREEGGRRSVEGARSDARRPLGPRAPDPAVRRGADRRRRRRRLEADLRQQYEDDIASYTTVQVDHILVKTKAEADEVYAQVTAPGATEQDFLDLAKEVSIDPSAKQNSGSLGSAVASTYVPEFAAAAIALEPGEISKPVKTQFGWHVIRMVDEGRAVVRGREAAAARRGRGATVVQRLAGRAGRRAARSTSTRSTVGSTPRRCRSSRISSTSTGTATPSAPPPAPLRVSEGLTHVPDGPVPASQGGARLLDLIRVQARLRAPGGCPWDARADAPDARAPSARGDARAARGDRRRRLRRDPRRARRPAAAGHVPRADRGRRRPVGRGRRRAGAGREADPPAPARVRRGRGERLRRGARELGEAQGRGEGRRAEADRGRHPRDAAGARARGEGAAPRGRLGLRVALAAERARRAPRGGRRAGIRDRGRRRRRTPRRRSATCCSRWWRSRASWAWTARARSAARSAGSPSATSGSPAVAAERGLDVDAMSEDEVRALFREVR